MQTHKTRLEEVLRQIRSTSFTFKIGIELEFYAKTITLDILKQHLAKVLNLEQCVYELIEEEGQGQYELVVAPSDNIIAYAQAIDTLRNHLVTLDGIDFSAKPYADEPGSAMHVHVSLYDAHGNNLFHTSEIQENSNYLAWAIAALLEKMPASMPIFCPHEADYQRYHFPDRNTPSTISWGGENRTVALRIPAIGEAYHDKRIEHRVPSPRADIYHVVAEILSTTMDGLHAKKQAAIAKTFGNAWDEQYGLAPLISKH